MRRVGLVVVAAMTMAACGRTETPAPAPAPAAEPAAQEQEAPPAPEAMWTVTEGIKTPESVYFDAPSGFIFASQIDGAPDGRDGNGRIVKLDASGKVVSATFTTGLNAPKGLRAVNGTLWTADLDEVVGIDVATGKITSRVKIPGAQGLNDVATASDGTVYVSDMPANRIYAVKGGKADVFLEGDQVEHANGLLVDGNRLIVGGWGSEPKADFSTDVPGHLFAIDRQTRQKTLITAEPFANIDGVEMDGKGNFLVSDFLKGQVIRVSPDGKTQVVAQFKPGAADFGVMPGHIIVPHMNENTIGVYMLP
jgi:hypothetical protein